MRVAIPNDASGSGEVACSPAYQWVGSGCNHRDREASLGSFGEFAIECQKSGAAFHLGKVKRVGNIHACSQSIQGQREHVRIFDSYFGEPGQPTNGCADCPTREAIPAAQNQFGFEQHRRCDEDLASLDCPARRRRLNWIVRCQKRTITLVSIARTERGLAGDCRIHVIDRQRRA